MTHYYRVLLAVALTLSVLRPSPIFSQILYGGLDGNISDASGGAVAGGTVTITHQQTGKTRTTTTDQNGAYTFPNLESGPYTLTVKMAGFQTFVEKDVAVSVNSLRREDMQLQIGAVTESVTVDASSTAVQTERPEVRHELAATTLENLPVPVGRDFENLLRLIPGIAISGGGPLRASNPSGAATINVNGLNISSTTTNIDGGTSRSAYDNGLSSYVPTLESIETVDVVTNSFGADQALVAGGSVNVHIKSGTNTFHGSLFEFHTDNDMKARPVLFPVTSVKPKFIYNQFGAAFGGPVIKNKLFFFGSYEGIVWRQTYSTFATVPSLNARAGILTESTLPIYDPLSGTATGSGRQAFPGNIIPTSRISPISAKILPLWPNPNQPGLSSNYFAAASSPYDRHTGDGKINWNVNQKLSTFLRMGYNRFDEFYPMVFGDRLGGPTISGQQSGTGDGGVDSLTLGATYILSPRLIFDGYVGYTLMVQNARQDLLNQQVGQNLGIPGTNGPRFFEGGWPRFLIDGYTTIGANDISLPWIRHSPSLQYNGNFNWTAGSHNLRWGFDITHRNLSFIQPNAVGSIFPGAGGFQFSNGVTQLQGGPGGASANAFASFLLGYPQQMGKTTQVPDFYSLYSRFYGLYVQDRWNITPRLTVSLGLRWDYFPLAVRGDRGLESYNAANNTMTICGRGDVPKDCGIQIPKLGFSPRVGLAYRATEKTVLRAGFSMVVDPSDPAPGQWLQDFPVIIYTLISGATSFQSVGNWANGIPPIATPDTSGGHIPIPGTAAAYVLPHNLRRGYVESWNATVQRQLPWGFVGQAAYVANHAVRLFGSFNLNAGQVIGAGTAGEPLVQQSGRTAATTLVWPQDSSTYNALQMTTERRFSGGLQVAANYTWSKALGTANGGGSIAALQYINRNKAPLNFNRAQVFNLTAVWQIPLGRGGHWLKNGFASKVVGGWQVNALFSRMAGLPFTVTSAATSLNLPGSTQTADQILSVVQILGGTGPGQNYFNPAAFAPVNAVRFGNSGFNRLVGPGLTDLDMGIFRDFRFTENTHLQFRAEAFNATNTPHWSNPQANVSSGGFAQITSVNASNLGRSGTDEKVLRLGLRVSF